MKLKRFIPMALNLIIGLQAGALPLLGETAGTIHDGVLTLYRDHADPNRVYFFPNSTEFSVDNSGVPLFNYVYWGLNGPQPTPEAGAYMTMSTHLAMDPHQKEALDHYMAKHPNMEVAVLPIKSSTIGLSSNVKDSLPLKTLFTEFNFAPSGGRAEDEIGVNAVLTATGAKAFKAVLKNEGAGQLIKMDYCYVTQGYGPNMDATITVDMRRVYDYFEANHSGGWGFWGWSIKAIVEKLNDGRTIRIEKNGGDAKDWEILLAVASDISNRLFKPELSATPVSSASSHGWFTIDAGGVHKEELKTETWRYIRRDLEERENCTTIAIKDLAPYLNKLVVNADE